MANPKKLVATVAAKVLRGLLTGLSAGDRSSIARSLMQQRFSPATRDLASFFTEALHAWKNRQYDVTLNGEEGLFKRLLPFNPSLFLDVGANVGDWSLSACQTLPSVSVHAFEIMPATADILRRNIAAMEGRIKVNPFGLSDRDGTTRLYTIPEDSTRASVVRDSATATAAVIAGGHVEPIDVEIVTGDAYAEMNNISHIDFLKVDVEGAELPVMRGFARTFARGAIDLVQFEYSQANLFTRDFLGDFHRFFAERGYAMGALYPEGVAFKSYDILNDEDFIGPNYVACRTARADLMAALACPPLTF
jgi:FkbM family methyltransferase